MDRKKIKWLYGEIPGLVDSGVLSQEAAQKLQDHYGNIEESNGLKTALTIFGILGSVLIGAGIILILAKNWSELSRVVRTVLSFAPLLIGQVLTAYALVKKRASAAWREGAAAFLFISIGASISLIGQTYNISGEWDNFLLIWMLLGLPLVYLLDVSLTGVFYIAGITVWAGVTRSEGGYTMIFWPLLFLMLPYLYIKIKKDPYSNPSTFLSWGTAISLCFAIGISLEKSMPGLWIIIYSSYFAVLYLSGKLWFREDAAFWQQPLQTAGRLGILAISFIVTFKWPWENIGTSHFKGGTGFHKYTGNLDYVIGAAIFIFAASLIYVFLRKKEYYKLLFAASALISLVCYILGTAIGSLLPVVIYNIYLLVLGIATVVKGIKISHFGVSNGGMLILALLAIMRFFDDTLGYEARGIAFIIVGAGFLLTNGIILKKRKVINS